MYDPERDIRDIPLSQLELSPGNVRKTPADASAFTELKASIAAHGLLENLIARSMGPGADGRAQGLGAAGGSPASGLTAFVRRTCSVSVERASRSGSRSRVNASVEMSLDTDAWKRQRVLFGVRV